MRTVMLLRRWAMRLPTRGAPNVVEPTPSESRASRVDSTVPAAKTTAQRGVQTRQKGVVELMAGDERGLVRDADLPLGQGVCARLAAVPGQVGDELLGPVAEVGRGEPGRPAAPEQRAAADAVGEPGEH